MTNNREGNDGTGTLLTTSSVARELGVAEGTVRVWEARGVLPATRLPNGMRLFRREDVERVIAERHAHAQDVA